MNHLHYTAKAHHLQYSIPQLVTICRHFYKTSAPLELKQRRHVSLCKVSDIQILTALLFQSELGITSQRHFYRIYQYLVGGVLLERTRFYRRAKYLIPLLKLIRQKLTASIDQETIAVMDSFPLPVCHTARNFKTRIFRGSADISYNPSKKMWFYGFKVHVLVTLEGYVLNFIVTPASVHDSKVAEALLEGCPIPIILGDLGYLSRELKANLAEQGYHLWTPWRENMAGARDHNHWKLIAERRTIETRFSSLCRLFDSERPLARSLTGMELFLQQAFFAHNCRYFN